MYLSQVFKNVLFQGHPLPNLDSQNSDGEWLKVFDQEQRGVNVGSSGMKMHT